MGWERQELHCTVETGLDLMDEKASYCVRQTVYPMFTFIFVHFVLPTVYRE